MNYKRKANVLNSTETKTKSYKNLSLCILNHTHTYIQLDKMNTLHVVVLFAIGKCEEKITKFVMFNVKKKNEDIFYFD